MLDMDTSGGSPPHMRGIPSARSRHLDNPGFTPAHAGNTRPYAYIHSSVGVHPRTCGEHGPSCRYRLSPGSPPHMRGTHITTIPRDSELGFTPACAGNTWLGVRLLLRNPAHPRPCGEYSGYEHWQIFLRGSPRPCGEYFDDTGLPVYVSGSPPPMRGILVAVVQV